LQTAGVAIAPSGFVQVDARFATSAPGIFAAGDVLGPPALASLAMEQARVAMCHAFDLPFKMAADRHWPRYVFSVPEVAWVGLSESEARAQSIDVEVGRSSFAVNAKARISGFADGLVKLIFRAEDRKLLGVFIVGELASELVHIGQFVLHTGGSIDRFIDATFAVPTRSEAYKYAAYDGLMRLARRTTNVAPARPALAAAG
jgi:NAD(P) transhydrogenase